MTETPGPYSQAAETYWAAGWRGIIPLPPKAKKYPPAGYTGAGGLAPSYPDVDSWVTGPEGAGNIALRLPPDVIGIDVDAYGDKLGAATLGVSEFEHGLLPPTWRTTARDDGVSGIRFYRVPEGMQWPGEIGPGVEIIQARHRYALVWPSIHPEGKTYRWVNPDGVVSTTVPDPDDFPALPEQWVMAYTGGELAAEVTRVNVGHSDAVAWIVAKPHATESMCRRMEKTTDQMAAALTGSAHNAARDAALRIARLADEGHYGAVYALAFARKAFLTDATSPDRQLLGKARRTEAEAIHEWGDIVASAVGLVIGSPSGMQTCDCHGQLTGLITDAFAGPTVTPIDPLIPPPQSHTNETAPDPTEATRLINGAAFILDAPDSVPSIWGNGDDCLWSIGEALMVTGPPGVGKTTLTGQILRGLIGLQPEVLGLTVNPTDKRVLYLAMDRPAQIARSLRRCFANSERELLTERVRVWAGPPPGDVARHPTVLLALAQLAEASVIIVDSLKDAAIGLTEDEVAAGYNRARQTCLANGVQVLELHHMVKRGAGGNKPTELADVYGSAWLTAGAGSVLLLWGAAGDPIVEMRHLKQPAAEVGPWRLRHDHTGGTTAIFHGADVLAMVESSGTTGVTAVTVARYMFDTDRPTDSQKEKARRKLNKLVTDELVATRAGEAVKGAPTVIYVGLAEAVSKPTGSPRGHFQHQAHDDPHAAHANGITPVHKPTASHTANGRGLAHETAPPFR